MWYYFIPTRMAIITTKKTVVSIDKDMGKLEFSYIAGGNVKCYRHFGSQSGSSYSEICRYPRPSTSSLSYIPRKLQTYIHTKSWTWTFMVALFKTSKRWKKKVEEGSAHSLSSGCILLSLSFWALNLLARLVGPHEPHWTPASLLSLPRRFWLRWDPSQKQGSHLAFFDSRSSGLPLA